MSRFISVRVVIVGAALGLICLVTSAQGWGQTKDGQNKESQAKNGQAKDSQARDRRLEDAQLDIRLLKQVVDEQARRITQLEKAVKALEAAAAGPAEERTKVVEKSSVVAPWQVSFAWTRIKMGMSRMDVEEILGPPTSVESVIDSQTLNYKAEVRGGEVLSGSVKLTGDRVSQVNPPGF